jgi:hypothetical protein
MREVTAILKQSIEYSLAHRAEAVDYALQYARDMGADLADRFVGMYVNQWTIDYGATGRKAVELLLTRGGGGRHRQALRADRLCRLTGALIDGGWCRFREGHSTSERGSPLSAPLTVAARIHARLRRALWDNLG